MAGTLLCRLCLNDKQVLDIFQLESNNSDQLCMCILLCTGVKILPEEKHTKYVCRSCCDVVVKLYQFRKNAIANDKALKAYFNESYTEPKCNAEDIANLNKSILEEKGDDGTVTEISPPKSEFKASKHFAVHPSVRRLFKSYPDLILPNELLKVHLSPIVVVEDLEDFRETRQTSEPIKEIGSSLKQRRLSIGKCNIKKVLSDINSHESFRSSVIDNERTNENEKQQCMQIPKNSGEIIKAHRVELPTTKNDKKDQHKEITTRRDSTNFNENKSQLVEVSQLAAVLTKTVENNEVYPIDVGKKSFSNRETDFLKDLVDKEPIESSNRQCREPIAINFSGTTSENEEPFEGRDTELSQKENQQPQNVCRLINLVCDSISDEDGSKLKTTENQPQNLHEFFRSAKPSNDNLSGKEAILRSNADQSATGEPPLKIAKVDDSAEVTLGYSESLSDAGSNNSEGSLKRKCLRPRRLQTTRYPSDDENNSNDGVLYMPMLNGYSDDEDLWETVDEELAFTCDVCNKMFDHKTKLKLHRRMHKKCEICCALFRSSDALSQHLKSTCYKKLIENQPVLFLRRCDQEGKENFLKVQQSDLTRTDNASDEVLCISDEDESVQGVHVMSLIEEELLRKITYKYMDYTAKPGDTKQVETDDIANIKITRNPNQVVLEDMYASLQLFRIPVELSVHETLGARICAKEGKIVEQKKISWSHVPVRYFGTAKFRLIAPIATHKLQSLLKQNVIPVTNISVNGVNQNRPRVPYTTEGARITRGTAVHDTPHYGNSNRPGTTKNITLAFPSVQHPHESAKLAPASIKYTIQHDSDVPITTNRSHCGPSSRPVILNGSTLSLRNFKPDNVHVTTIPKNASQRSLVLKVSDSNNKNQFATQANKAQMTVNQRQDDAQPHSFMPTAVPQSYPINFQPAPNPVYLQTPANIVQSQTTRRAYTFSVEHNAYILSEDSPRLPQKSGTQGQNVRKSSRLCSKQLTQNEDLRAVENSPSRVYQPRQYPPRVVPVSTLPADATPSPGTATPLNQILETQLQGSTAPHQQQTQTDSSSYLRVKAPWELNKF